MGSLRPLSGSMSMVLGPLGAKIVAKLAPRPLKKGLKTDFVGFLIDFEFSMAVLGVGRGPIAFAAPWRFKILDSQPDSLNMGPAQTDFDEIYDFQKS